MCEPKIQFLAEGMFGKAVIPEALLKNPTFKDVIGNYKSSFDQINTPNGILEHFEKFVSVFESIDGRGGYYILGAIGLKADVNQELRAALNITFDAYNIDIAQYL